MVFSWSYMMCDDITTLAVKEMWAPVFFCIKVLPFLISNMVTINRYNTHNQQLFGVLSDF